MSAAPQRILIVRLSALGDVVMASGLIPSLRARWPSAQLSWLTEAPAVPLLHHNPLLHQVLIWPRNEWRELWRARRFARLWQSVRAFRQHLLSQQFDLVLDAQGLLKSGLCAWMTGAPRRIGLLPREGTRWLMHEAVIPPEQPDGDAALLGTEYRYLAQYLGAPAEAFRLDLALGNAARQVAQQALLEAGVQGRYALLCPFTTRPQKHWFEDRWSALAVQLAQQGLPAVLLGGPADHAAAQRIAEHAPGIVNLTGRLKLDETAAAIAGGTLLIGVDTGLTHMGSALRVPTLALFGSTRPYLDAGVPGTRVLYDALHCSPCRRHPTCDGRYDCMQQFSVERVLQAATAVLRMESAPQ